MFSLVKDMDRYILYYLILHGPETNRKTTATLPIQSHASESTMTKQQPVIFFFC